MKPHLFAIGGLSRSGTNYCNTYFGLHPDIWPGNYVSKLQMIAAIDDKHPTIPELIVRLSTRKRRPMHNLELKKRDLFDYYHAKQDNLELQSMACKADMGNSWYGKILPEIDAQAQVIFAMRDPVAMYGSWKRWKDFPGPQMAADWIRHIKGALRNVVEMEEAGLKVATVNISKRHSDIHARLKAILNQTHEESPEQQHFMEYRFPLAVNFGGHAPRDNAEELREEIEAGVPDFTQIEAAYNQLYETYSPDKLKL